MLGAILMHERHALPPQVFKVAVEEAKQILDTRQGRTPATDHDVTDLLRPETWPDDWVEAPEQFIQFPAAPEPRDLDICNAVTALQWLLQTGKQPMAPYQVYLHACICGRCCCLCSARADTTGACIST